MTTAERERAAARAASPVRRPGFSASAFGLAVEADFELPGFERSEHPLPGPELALRLVPEDELRPLTGELWYLRDQFVFDGWPYAMLDGPGGDVLMSYGDRALFHLSADARTLRCAVARRDDPTWQRVLLDTVLWTVSLLRGYELLHASAVRTEAGLVAFVAATGGGKTSLAVEYLRRGGALFCDDILAMELLDGRPVGHPGPPLMNVPNELAGSMPATTHVVADFGEERWVRVERPALSAQPLAAVVVVNRAPGLRAGCSPLAGTRLMLLRHTVGFRHLAERDRTRFELLAALASTTPLLELTADPSVPPTTLADLVTDALEAL